MIQGGNGQDAERNATQGIHMQTSTKSLLIGLALSSATALAMPVQALETHSKHENESLLKMQRIEKIAQVKEVKKDATKAAKAVVDANNKVGKGAQKAVKAVADVNVKAVKKVEKGLKKLKFW